MIHLPNNTQAMTSTSSTASTSSPEDVRCMAFTDQYLPVEEVFDDDDDDDDDPHHNYNQNCHRHNRRRRRVQLLALGSFGKIMVYDLRYGLVCTLTEGLYGFVQLLQFSPNGGKYLVAYSTSSSYLEGKNPLVVFETSSFFHHNSNNKNSNSCGSSISSSGINNYHEINLQQATSNLYRHLHHDGGRPRPRPRNSVAVTGRIQQLGWFDKDENENDENDDGHHRLWFITQDNTLWKCDVGGTGNGTGNGTGGECSRMLYWGPRRWFCKLLTVVVIDGPRGQSQPQPQQNETTENDNNSSSSSRRRSTAAPPSSFFWSIVKFEGCLKLIQQFEHHQPQPQGQQQHHHQQQQRQAMKSIVLHDHADACGMKYFDVSPCRKHLVAGGDHGLVQVWFHVIPTSFSSSSSSSFATKIRLSGLQAAVKSVTFSPDGQFLAASDAIGMIMIWKIDDIMNHHLHQNPSSKTFSSSVSSSSPPSSSLTMAATVTVTNSSTHNAIRFFSSPCTFVRYENNNSSCCSSSKGLSSSSCSNSSGRSKGNHDCCRRRRHNDNNDDDGHLSKKRHTTDGHDKSHYENADDDNNNDTDSNNGSNVATANRCDCTSATGCDSDRDRDLGDGRGQRRVACGVAGVRSISFTPDSRMLSAASTDGKVRFWSRTKWGMNPSSLLYYCHDDNDNDNDKYCGDEENGDYGEGGHGVVPSSGRRRYRRTDSFSTFVVGCQ